MRVLFFSSTNKISDDVICRSHGAQGVESREKPCMYKTVCWLTLPKGVPCLGFCDRREWEEEGSSDKEGEEQSAWQEGNPKGDVKAT